MKARELNNLGLARGPALKATQAACGAAARAGLTKQQIRDAVAALVASPDRFASDPVWGGAATAILDEQREHSERVEAGLLRDDDGAPFRLWGRPGEDFEPASVDQLRDACSLPSAAAGALMPDAHVGYGLPIGGVLATRRTVVPYAVGVDIACRVRLSVLDLPAGTLDSDAGRDRLTKAIETETRFGMGAEFSKRGPQPANPRDHAVLDEAAWDDLPDANHLKSKARAQLGTSGSGNHFVEFGVLTIGETDGQHQRFDLEPGRYLALLSHSGSRGPGAAVCNHFSRLAEQALPGLPKALRRLAWLDLASEAGEQYWNAMNLMGRFASANHACIHEHIAKHLGATEIAGVENHHNFAWKETHDLGNGPEELIVHRKGATPAAPGELGVIPGSMADPCFVVIGNAGPESLGSASHGAGRVMSRGEAKRKFRWNHLNELLRERGVTLLSAGIDENPHVYKDIRRVMAQQRDLVTPIARFDPKLVKMAPEGEKAED